MLNRKFADLRHSPDLDPHVLSYDATALPQAVIAIGPRAQRKTKRGIVLAEPGFTWALFLFPVRWYAVTSAYDQTASLVAHHVDICLPQEENEGVLSFVDLKLDLLIRANGEAFWVDREEFQEEVASGSIPLAWQKSVSETVGALDREYALGTFPPDVIRRFRPRGPHLR